MCPDVKWDTTRRLLHQALELDPAEREQFLSQACVDRPDLLAEVRSLLAWNDAADDFLETPVVSVDHLLPQLVDPKARVGQSLGAWRIVDLIGQGGMGAVYRAERADAAFTRVVAIKIVRRDAASHDVIERFQQERETLAALDHPNIARLIDGGSTPDGEPYFVMEYVDGTRVDTYCDEHRLTLAARLDVFRTICLAVQHAHRRLVVHRDLKPDNILVSTDGEPKLLDFGIARVLSPTPVGRDDARLATLTWRLTPDYASPEQITGGPLTTANDVYSLGVLLHVLLVGRPPYQLRLGTHAELSTQLEQTIPAAASSAIDQESAMSREIAAARQTEPARLRGRLRGDLDAIVAHALARDPAARYPSVDQLLDDLDRHRSHYPVRARRGGWGYRAGRFAKRHRTALLFAAALVAVVVGGVGAVIWQASVAAEARARAERRFEDVRTLARTFIFDVDRELVNVPGTTRVRELTMLTANRYLTALARESSGDLGLQRELAAALVRVGDAQGNPTSPNVGDIAGARSSYQQAIDLANAILRSAPGDVDAERTRALAFRRLSDVLAWSGEANAALPHAESSRYHFLTLAARAGATDEDQLQGAIAVLKLGDLLGNPNLPNLRRPDEARPHYDESLRQLQSLASRAPDHPGVQRYLGLVYERLGTLDELKRQWPAAAAAYQESFRIRRALAHSSPEQIQIVRDFAIAYEKLGKVLRADGRLADAETNLRGALSEFQRLAAIDPANVAAARTAAISRELLADTVGALGRRQEAIELLTVARQTHVTLADGDRSNAQARCDAARLDELLGDVHASARSIPPAAACGHWRASQVSRVQLRADNVSCLAAEEMQSVRTKLTRCR